MFTLQRNLTRLLSSLLISKVVYTIFINLQIMKKRTEQKSPTVLLYYKTEIHVRNKKKLIYVFAMWSRGRTLDD